MATKTYFVLPDGTRAESFGLQHVYYSFVGPGTTQVTFVKGWGASNYIFGIPYVGTSAGDFPPMPEVEAGLALYTTDNKSAPVSAGAVATEEVNLYTISISAGTGGTVKLNNSTTLTQDIEEGATVTASAEPYGGYHFVSWTGGYESPVIEFVCSDNASLAATFAANGTYAISYDLGGGSHGTDHPDGATYGVVFGLSHPTHAGYDSFAGWTVTSGLNAATAKYGNSSGSVTKSIPNSTTLCKGATVAKTFFTNLTDAGGSVTLTANWSGGKKYAVTLNANGGSGGTSSVQATYGSAMPSITRPTRSGYAFDGFYDTDASTGGTKYYNADGSSATPWDKTSATTLYARWSAYTVTFDANGGSVAPASATGVVTLPTPGKSGYACIGWYTAASGGTKVGNVGESYAPKADITIYAQWGASEYTLTVNPNGGTFRYNNTDHTSAVTVSPNLKFGTRNWGRLGVATRTGYSFLGWYSDSDEWVWDAEGKARKGIYWTESYDNNGTWQYDAPGDKFTASAHWDAKASNLIFDANGGTGTMPTGKTATYGSAMPTFGESAPTKAGYAFGGFYDTRDTGGTQYYTASLASARTWNKDTSSDVTLYARWGAREHTLKVNPNGGTYKGSTSATTLSPNLKYGTTAWWSIGAASRTGYSLKGFYTAASGGTKLWDSGGFAVKATGYWSETHDNGGVWVYDGTAGDFTTYAQWEANKTSLSYSMNGGNWGSGVTPPASADYGTATEIPAPAKEHFVFKGWTVTGAVASGAKWGTSGGSVATDLSSGMTIAGSSPTASVWVKNLNADNNRAVALTATWEPISYTAKVKNGAYRWDLKISGDGVDLAVPSRTTSEQSFTVKAGSTYAIVATFKKKEWTDGGKTIIPDSICNSTYVSCAYSRIANDGDGYARFQATWTPGDSETENSLKLIDQSVHKLAVVEGGTNPVGETLLPVMKFKFATGLDISFEAPETEKSEFVNWTDIDPTSAISPAGDTSNENPVALNGSTGVTLKMNYKRADMSVSAAKDAASDISALSGVTVAVYAGTPPNLSNDPASAVGWGTAATWKVLGTIPADYQFDGWYRQGALSPESTSDTYTVASVEGATALHAKFKAKVTFNKNSNGTNVDGYVGLQDRDPFAVLPADGYFTLGSTIGISATPANGGSYFAGWFKGASFDGASRLAGLTAQAEYTVTSSVTLFASFIDTDAVFYVALYTHTSTGYASIASLTSAFGLATSAGEVVEFEDDPAAAEDPKTAAQKYADASGYAPVAAAVTAGAAKFYKVVGIRRVDASATYAISQTLRPTRITLGYPTSEGTTANPAVVSNAMPFSSVVDRDFSFEVHFGDVSHVTVTAGVVDAEGGAHGRVFVANASSTPVSGGDGVSQSGSFVADTMATVIAAPDNGYVFDGWYSDAAGTSRIEGAGSTYEFAASDDAACYAKFVRGSFALYRWEGARLRKRLRWQSKVYALSKPANLTSVRVDSTTLNPDQEAYPVDRFKYESFSAPDAEATSTVDFAQDNDADLRLQKDQMRRLPQCRPERYFQVEIENHAEVDAIYIGTSGEGLAT